MDSNDNDEYINTSLLQNSNHGFIIHRDELDDDILNDGENSNSDAVDDKMDHPLREQDRFLPIANIAKIMKRTVPETGKIAKDARECVQECVSEFISFITSEASERCFLEKRKTINGEDILFAMSSLGFDNYIDPLKQYLQKYREVTKGEKSLSGLYEEISHDSFANASLNENGLTEHSPAENSILYTYTDQVPSFNLQ